MTKEKLRRLIALSICTALFRPHREYAELQALQAEFEAWEPSDPRPHPPKDLKPMDCFREQGRH